MNYANALAAFQRVPGWRKSSHSTSDGECVEVAKLPGWVGVRDSKLGTASPILAFTVAEWRHLLAAVKSGAFDF